jgi:hypothetical protein
MLVPRKWDTDFTDDAEFLGAVTFDGMYGRGGGTDSHAHYFEKPVKFLSFQGQAAFAWPEFSEGAPMAY